MKSAALFLFNSLCLGTGLAMDAFSLSVVTGMNEPDMTRGRAAKIAGVFGFFQGIMPMLGWVLTCTVLCLLTSFQPYVPRISLCLLLFIGARMILNGHREECGEQQLEKLPFGLLLMQGVATSLDALSAGFAIADYDFYAALLCALIIAAVTFGFCFCGARIGRRIGDCLAGKASVFGGVILIFIGIEIFVRSLI